MSDYAQDLYNKITNGRVDIEIYTVWQSDRMDILRRNVLALLYLASSKKADCFRSPNNYCYYTVSGYGENISFSTKSISINNTLKKGEI